MINDKSLFIIVVINMMKDDGFYEVISNIILNVLVVIKILI